MINIAKPKGNKTATGIIITENIIVWVNASQKLLYMPGMKVESKSILNHAKSLKCSTPGFPYWKFVSEI
mgnify:CR=1 FL=1